MNSEALTLYCSRLGPQEQWQKLTQPASKNSTELGEGSKKAGCADWGIVGIEEWVKPVCVHLSSSGDDLKLSSSWAQSAGSHTCLLFLVRLEGACHPGEASLGLVYGRCW